MPLNRKKFLTTIGFVTINFLFSYVVQGESIQDIVETDSKNRIIKTITATTAEVSLITQNKPGIYEYSFWTKGIPTEYRIESQKPDFSLKEVYTKLIDANQYKKQDIDLNNKELLRTKFGQHLNQNLFQELDSFQSTTQNGIYGEVHTKKLIQKGSEKILFKRFEPYKNSQ